MPNDATPPLAAPTPELIARLGEIVGPAHAVTDPDQQLPYLREWRDRYIGRTPLVLRPGSTEEVARILALAHEAGVGVVPQAGNTGLVGGQIPYETGREIVLSVGRLKRVRHVDPAGLRHDGRSRPDAGRGPGGGAQRRPPPAPQPAVGGQLPDRRRARDERRRARRARLRQRAQPGAGPRGGARRRPRLERPAQPQEGQHRLRPQAALRRAPRARSASSRRRSSSSSLPSPSAPPRSPPCPAARRSAISSGARRNARAAS